MGGNLSTITPSSTTAAVDSYVAELGDVQHEKSSARFLKTIRGKTRYGHVVVKIFIKPELNFSVKRWVRQMREERGALADVPNAFPYIRCIETEKAGYLIRQYLYGSLYDRIRHATTIKFLIVSTRPFLEVIEKRWIAFQLLCGLRDCHAKGIHHGDIKTENVLVTTWNWVYLTDFACFKPTYLPEDNPADFSFFFDTSLRRVCYVAPERFLTNGETKSGGVTDAMDIFSLGCVIAELFLEGTPLFSLSQMFKYRKGEYDPIRLYVDKIEDNDIKSLVQHMIALDPVQRFTADKYLQEWKNKAFPEYFTSFLHGYIFSITDGNAGNRALAQPASERTTEGDERLSRIYHDFDKIAFFLGFVTEENQVNGNEIRKGTGKSIFPVQIDLPNYSRVRKPLQSEPISSKDGALIFLSLIVSTIRNTAKPQSRVEACDTVLALSERISDEAKLDRVLPYLIALLNDDVAIVRATALRTITQLLANIKILTPVNAFFFSEYVLPKLNKFPFDKDTFVRCTYASCISLLAESASRFLEIAQALRADGSLSYNDEETENTLSNGVYSTLYDVGRKELLNVFQEHVVALLADSESAVRRALLGSITSLCVFFGRQRSNDFLLSHLITYLNDRDWMLRCAFFESIVGVATFVGGRSLEEYILPLLTQAITDTEEFVIEKVLNALASLTELGLFHKISVLELAKSIVKLVVHPNVWVSNGAIGFLATSAKSLGGVDAQSLLYPIFRPYLICDISTITEQKLLDNKQKPIPRVVYDAAISWATKAERTNYWKPFKDQPNVDISTGPLRPSRTGASNSRTSSSKSNVLDKASRTEEDEQWLAKLRGLGMSNDDEWKLANLRQHIWKIAQLQASTRSKKEDKPTAIIHSNAIDLNTLDIKPTNIFFYPPGNGTDGIQD